MKKVIIILGLVCLVTSGCTENQNAKRFGGKETIYLSGSQRLVNATWKGDDLWLLTTWGNTPPKTYYFTEKSSYGILEGEICIKEQ